MIAYPELGTEAVMRLEVEDFPAVVVNDVHGADLVPDRRGAIPGIGGCRRRGVLKKGIRDASAEALSTRSLKEIMTLRS